MKGGEPVEVEPLVLVILSKLYMGKRIREYLLRE